MITITEIKKELMPRLSSLSVMNQLVQTIYVDSNPAQIEYIEVNKSESGESQAIKVSKQVKLKKHKLIVKSMGDLMMIISDEVNSPTITGNKLVCECISQRLNHDFLDTITSDLKVENWTFFNQGIIRRLFHKRRNLDLINKIFQTAFDSNWIIISNSTYSILSKSTLFKENSNKSDSIIKNVGQLNLDQLSINVYLNTELVDDVIYFGRYDSVSIVVNKNLIVNELKSTRDRKTISVEVEYQFIVNRPIKCLYL